MLRSTSRSFLLTFLCLATALGSTAGRGESPAAPEAKRPWEWTLDERLERRFDPQDMDRRLAEAATEAGRPSPERGTTLSLVDGSREPELLLPGEIFRWLLWQGYAVRDPETRESWRKGFAQGAVASGLGDGFLNELEQAAAEGIRVQREQRAALQAYSEAHGGELRRRDADMKVREEAACAAQAKALEAARARFGRPLFDRYLYEVVAPAMGRISQRSENRDWLRQQDTGCSAAKRFAAAQEGPSAADRQPGFEAKEPWEWTLYERLERRFDPQDMDRRLAEAEARAGRPAPEPGTTISIVNGRREPELLLPGEIFSRLLRLGFVLTSNPENRDTWRTGFAQGAEKLGLGEHFLDELEKVTAGAIRAHREEEAAHLEASKGTHSDRKRLEEEAEQRARAQCAAQATALEAARARFGRTLFDRYLYEVVALEMSSSSQGFQSEDMLRWHETGCP